MEPAGEVIGLANELARAIKITMDPAASQQARMDAYVACERFKEVSPLCAQAGLFLVTENYPSIVRHFGLQLMEHTVKFNWNSISQQEKIFIKENAMKLLCAGVGDAQDQSVSHIKDGLSRIIVEMIKREWPQQWTTLLAELSDACSKGVAQTELVLLVFLRLVEDVALLQTIESNQRRKDIYQALTVNMSEIFDFFLRLIELHVGEFRNSTTIGNKNKAHGHSRVVQVALLTLTGFVEWVSINHIMAANGRLLQILCVLLIDEEFQQPAAECLLQIVNRKGQIKDRKPLLLLFDEAPVGHYYRAALQSERMGSESYYAFLKKLIQVLSGLAIQLTGLWGKEDCQISRQSLSTFLETVITFTRHSSYTLNHSAALIWMSLLKHEQICRDPLLLEYIPKVIELIGPKIIKVGYPISRPTEITMHPHTFISLDYDGEEEWLIFFSRCRTDMLEIFRQATLIAPLVTFSYCEQWLNARLQKVHSEINTTCSITDPVYLEWDALVNVLDGVLSRILLVTERPSVATGLRLLEECLKVESNDPLILSVLLSCISALFVFLSMSSCQITSANCVAMSGVQLLPRVLDKIFAALVFQVAGETRYNRSKAVKNQRRHAASLMVKIAHKYPLLLLPIFDQINTSVHNLIRQRDQLSNVEQVTLLEALLLISNHFCDYERQSNFVAEVTRDAVTLWMHLSPVVKNAHSFIDFVGLNKPPVQPSSNLPDQCNINRGQIVFALNLILGVIKRCSWPDDPDRCSRGGFVVAFTESGNPICRNPATSHVVPLLPHILGLMRVLNELWKSDAMNAVDQYFKCANGMQEHEKKQLLGISPVLQDPLDPNVKSPPTAFDRMQTFLSQTYEHCYHMMGSAGPSLGRDLYALPGIADALISSIFACLENVPDFRLRTLVRVFFKPFVYSCAPVFHESVLLPIFAHFAPFMLTRLTARWQYITALYETGELGEDVSDTQEVLEDMLNRSLTREYIDVLKVALVGCTVDPTATTTNESSMDHDDQSMDGPTQALTRAAQSAMTSEVISDLGGKLLRNQYTCTPIVMTVLSVLSWNDSNSSLKATFLSGPVIRFLAAEQLITDILASNIIIAVLQGLQLHGQHESNQASLITLGVQTYEILRPKFPCILEVLQQIPNISSADIQKLDEKISMSASTKGNKIDKAKKDLFKKITSHIMGRSVGQHGKKEVRILNLPPMVPPIATVTRNAYNVIDGGQETGLAHLFASRS
ncbi:exportin-5 [Malaya genurostris]|uniref:exportin-5 n=1 Tax=Malaya genurostris TaxID=325434 RepID=UPI0026F38364|nr:exportin-5 [Malaya genurostris]XP_058459073.1 exportin-5 [Malaya genurostris]XP_058459074.1 exportin-5 [Malaya genurostris]